MILTDVDGTLTDGTLAVLPDGEEIKTYHVKDGLGVLLAQLVGLKLGHHHRQDARKGLEKRAERLKITELHQGVIDKRPVFDGHPDAATASRPEEVAYIGDDLGDLEVMKPAGLAGGRRPTPIRLVRKHAHYVCRARGGRGAFRELVDFIIAAQKKWDVDHRAVQDASSIGKSRTTDREETREDQSEHFSRIRHPGHRRQGPDARRRRDAGPGPSGPISGGQGRRQVAVGRDCRLSSPAYGAGFAEGPAVGGLRRRRSGDDPDAAPLFRDFLQELSRPGS